MSDVLPTTLRQRASIFAAPQLGMSLREFFLAFLGYIIFAGAALWFFTASSWFSYVVCCIIAGLFLLKLFTIQHDCGHGAYFRKESWNRYLGRFVSLFTIVPFAGWKMEHNIHHSQVANFDLHSPDAHSDLHNIGDIHVLSVAQYRQKSWLGKLLYRIYRTPFFLIVIGTILYYFIRLRYPVMLQKKLIWSAVLNNLFVLIFYAALGWIFGGYAVFYTVFLCVYIAGFIGVFLFYVQHQFDDMIWFTSEDWEFEKAVLAGSSFLKLPRILNWLSSSIGYHHIHHYNSRIPFYRLKETYDAIPEFQQHKPITLLQAIKSLRLKLWSFEMQKMIGWKEFENLPQKDKHV